MSVNTVNPTDSREARDDLLVAPSFRSICPLERPSPVGKIAADVDRGAVDPPSCQRIQLSADGRHSGFVNESQTVVDTAHGDQGIALLLHAESLQRRYGESFADLLCQLCLTESFLRVASADRKIGNHCRHLPTADRYDRTEGRGPSRQPDRTQSARTNRMWQLDADFVLGG
jgi:hypothetical protein